MHVGQTTTRRLRTIGLVGALALAGAPFSAAAAVTTVSCDGSGDIAAVQAAVDAAADGDTIALDGTCDFTGASPHAGTPVSISNTAVLIRPGSPVTNLRITSAGASQSALIQGSGTQAAFTIAPGNTGVTINGLRFLNVARAVVVAGADGATIGSAVSGSTPSTSANRILGGTSMDSAILAFASSTPQTVSYGTATSQLSATFTPTSVNDLTVRGNYISFEPPGTGSADVPVVGVDVRQSGTGVVDGVTIDDNAVGMFSSEFASAQQNGIRVEALTAVPASSPPALADYPIRDVSITDNNLGRLEELDPAAAAGIETGDAHAGGRIGIVLERVGGFTVAANRVRARVGGGLLISPGGGIVAGDSAFGTINDNRVVVLADPTAVNADLGGIGVFDGLAKVMGDAQADQAAYDIDIVSNLLGAAEIGATGVGRGLVVNGADLVTAHSNTVALSTDDALHLGASVSGPGGDAPRSVTRAVLCGNLLDGKADDPNEVSFTNGTPASAANAFPTGDLIGGTANSDCVPRATLAPSPVLGGDSLFVGGRAWASRAVKAVVTGGTASVSRAGVADAAGNYSIEITSAELSALPDGPITGVVTASDTSGFSLSSLPAKGTLNAVIDDPMVGTLTIYDNLSTVPASVDGYSNYQELLIAGIKTVATKPSDPSVVKTILWFSRPDASIPSGCGPFTINSASFSVKIPISSTASKNCAGNLPEGTYFANVQWVADDGDVSQTVSVASIKDTVKTTPVILTPAEGSLSTTSSVVVSGAAEAGATVYIRDITTLPAVDLGNTATNGTGSWSLTLALENRRYTIDAYSLDVARNESLRAQRSFFVNDGPPDTTPPQPPVITSPITSTSIQPSKQTWTGTAEPFTTVSLLLSGTAFKSTTVGADGTWSTKSNFSPSGTYTVTARATDASGNVSADSNAVTITVDAALPITRITTPYDQVYLLSSTARVIEGTVTDANAVSTAPDAVVVKILNETKGLVGHFAVTSCTGCGTTSATWSLDLPGSLLPGFYYAVATGKDAAGNASVSNEIRFIVVP